MKTKRNILLKYLTLTKFLLIPVVLLLAVCSSCGPKEPIQFRAIRNITVTTDSVGVPVLRGEAVFYNPNKLRMKLKEIKMEVFVEGKKSAEVDQKPDLVIPAAAEFTARIEAHLSLKDINLMDAVMNLFGGKKYNMQYVGYVRVRVHGITVRVPVNFSDELKLKM